MTTTTGQTRTMTQGFETRTFTTAFENGNGWTTKMFSTWKGEDAGETKFADGRWFDTNEEAEKDMNDRADAFEAMGWK